MDEKRLLEILAAYGSDTTRWPDAERDSAVALMQQKPPATAMAEEAALDSLLLGEAPLPLPQGYLQRMEAVLGAVPGPALPARKSGMMVRLVDWLHRFLRPAILRPAAGLCTAAIIGLAAGTLMPPPSTGADGGAYNDQDDLYRPVDVASIAYGSSGYGLVVNGQEGWGQ